MGTTASTDWKELAQRENDGIEVTLLWSTASGQVIVVVDDERFDERFELDVPADEALNAFHHPFAYASRRPIPRQRRDRFATEVHQAV